MSAELQWKEHPVGSWSELESAIGPYRDDGWGDWRRYAFRGQKDHNWPLTSSLTRILQRHETRSGPLKTDPTYFENYALHLFKSRAVLHVDVTRHVSDDWKLDWLVLAQHYSVSTRLLDWTWSPYVAAYFACERCAESVRGEPERELPGAVWCGPLEHVNDSSDGSEPLIYGRSDALERILQSDIKDTVMFFRPRHNNVRTVAQQGLFSVASNLLGNHEQLMEDSVRAFLSAPSTVSGAHEHDFLRKIVIRAEAKRDIRRVLRSMNISAETLFPGLEGLGRSINDLVVAHPEEYDANVAAASAAVIRSKQAEH